MKNKWPSPSLLVLFLLVCQSGFPLTKEGYLYWAEKFIGGVTTICEPILLIPSPKRIAKYKAFLSSWQDREKHPFRSIILCDLPFNIPDREITPPFDTKTIPDEKIAGLFLCRQAVKNDLSHLKPIYESTWAWFGAGGQFRPTQHTACGYLEYFQLLSMELLISNKDLRFSNEAQSLLNYLKNTKIDCSKEEAILYYAEPMILQRLIVKYLLLCKGNQ